MTKLFDYVKYAALVAVAVPLFAVDPGDAVVDGAVHQANLAGCMYALGPRDPNQAPTS